uniref:Uncharacterized protein n=1 Tax=Anguilla anguilla TaxID=7936 RepID=A0A0E9US83_ANGAN
MNNNMKEVTEIKYPSNW